MVFLQWYARRVGAYILLSSALLAPTAAYAAARKSAPAKKPAKTTPRPPLRKATPEEIERAGVIASHNADQQQAERYDPSIPSTGKGRKTGTPATEDRIHEWIRQHHEVSEKPVAKKRSTKPAIKPAEAAKTKTDAGPRKATAEDFDHAAEEQQHAEEPKPEKPRGALSLPDDEEEAAPQADAKVTKAEAAAVAKSPTTKLKLDLPPEDRKHVSVAATLARGHQAVIDPETAGVLAKKEFPSTKKRGDDRDADEDSEDDASAVSYGPKVLPILRTRRGRVIMPAPMKGSREILVRQNVMADQDGLDRIADDDQLNDMRRMKLLVALPSNSAIRPDDDLPANRRYARPWTVRFLSDLARAHYARFHGPVQVNSAVRTVDFQRRLMRVNGNAAPPTGDTASPHLTGQAVDLAKHGMDLTEIAWMRGYLLPLVQQGKIDVEEEFQQACFHISVYRRYIPAVAPKRKIGTKRNGTGRLLASAVR
jgi:hypothetical protein